MITTGLWAGYYKFDNEAIQKTSGFEHTNFEIKIQTINKNSFTGIVEDNLETGGTEGIGEIKGNVLGERVEFVKQMPIMTLIVDKKGTRKTLNKKHRPIYYSGTFSGDKKTISGNWKFKFGFIWLGLLPIPVPPTKGTWQMKLIE
ncbi:MAG: hypothetical protein ABJB11_24610 [Ferruginibacter sp.]